MKMFKGDFKKTKSVIKNSSGVLGLFGLTIFVIGLLFLFTWWIGAIASFAYVLGPVGASFGIALWAAAKYTIFCIVGSLLSIMTGIVLMAMS